MEQSRTTVDVLIPAYNAEATIADAIGSLQRQTFQDFRILVVNDGSTDGTGQVLQRIAAQDPRVHVTETTNRGIVAARNTLLELSSTPILAVLDADDISLPNRLAQQLAYLRSHPDCIAVGVNAWYIDEQGRRLGGHSTFKGDVRFDPATYPSVEPYLINGVVMLRRDAVLAAGGYRHVTNAEDTDLYWRLLPLGRLHSLDDVLAEVRMTSVSASSSSAQGGRISAVHSQLAAISYLRRKTGQPDLTFPEERSGSMRRAKSMEELLALVAGELSPPEADYLRLASAAKLLELASYRPYLLEVGDCRMISQTVRKLWPRTQRAGRAKFVYQQAHVLARLLRHARWREAQALGSMAVLGALIPALAVRQIKSRIQDSKARRPVERA